MKGFPPFSNVLLQDHTNSNSLINKHRLAHENEEKLTHQVPPKVD